MKITNLTGLPQPIVDAVSNDPYTGGSSESHISVTRLIQPPRKVALDKLHAAEMEEDAADRIWSLMGQLGHSILERSGGDRIVEKRFFIKILGLAVSGQVDIIDNDTLLDYKFTSVYTVKDGLKPEWEQQLNLNALLCLENGINILGAQIVCVFRDWSVMEAKRDPSYPQKQVKVLTVPMWEREQMMTFAIERVMAHQKAQGGELPKCSSEDRWERPAVWAVMKKGGKRATKLHSNPDDAQEQAQSMGSGYYVETRPPVQIRCANYCSAFPWCEQGQALVPKETVASEEN